MDVQPPIQPPIEPPIADYLSIASNTTIGGGGAIKQVERRRFHADWTSGGCLWKGTNPSKNCGLVRVDAFGVSNATYPRLPKRHGVQAHCIEAAHRTTEELASSGDHHLPRIRTDA